ncbi:hypothetical protein [Caudoviricetes sp.]|nr:hypothetical protein [Caudoviricetes sp.]
MLIIKYPDNEKWPELIRAIMSVRAFQERFKIGGDGRITHMAKAKNLPLKTVVFMSEAIELIQKEKAEQIESMRA